MNNAGSTGGSGGPGQSVSQTISVGTLVNTGHLFAGNGTTTFNVASGGFAGLANGILSLGSLDAYAGGSLVIHADSLIETDAANIALAGGSIFSRDPGTGQDRNLLDTLQRVATGGTLMVDADGYHLHSLALDGELRLSSYAKDAISSATTTFDQLTIGAAGRLPGIGTVAGRIQNDGVIQTGIGTDAFRGALVVDGVVTGSGSFEIRAGHAASPGSPDPSIGTTLELRASTAQAVRFDDGRRADRRQPSGHQRRCLLLCRIAGIGHRSGSAADRRLAKHATAGRRGSARYHRGGRGCRYSGRAGYPTGASSCRRIKLIWGFTGNSIPCR